jgi:hypothetical protein
MFGAVCATALVLVGCGSSTEPVLTPVPDETREAMLFDVVSGDILDPAAFDVLSGSAVRTDQFSGWDFLFQVADGGAPLLWPRAAVIGEGEDAGLRRMEIPFDELREAPELGYATLDSVSVAEGDVFAVRSRRDPIYGSIRCRRYAKLEVLGIDEAEGTISFQYLVNPNCEKRTLVPGATE